ncbi:uncharacterized protein LOC106165379 [Lingula anatina]|uniref:Uncharacterized protein LOC106165379 n=1 Tax=Lingula anatina TaxID=7574 RepID=A0A1S3ILS9_LINAN|nr:uncharacterized protein LOC106165379 [Lingula anatina]|eukprot:XP_013399038.1 uncharacterized protein LOC106165379 [Lingula anatina]
MSSLYRDSLESDVQRRYDEKIRDIGGLDPYCIAKKDLDKDKKSWPHVTTVDLVDFLIFRKSYYTTDELRSYKSLEAYKLFQDGWIKEILHKEINSFHLLKAKVYHSMRIREKPLEPWVIVSNKGDIRSGHCTCMAGLGEACSHIATLLFAAETWTKIRQEASVTDVPAYWMMPSSTQLEHPHKRIRNIDFQSASKKRKTSETCTNEPNMNNFSSPTKQEMASAYQRLHRNGKGAAVLATTEGYAQHFEPKTVTGDWPIDMKTVHKADLLDAELDDVLTHVDSVDISVTSAQAAFVEAETRNQARSKKWQKYRVGRITASKTYQVTHTSTETPSKSIYKSICQPLQVSSAALEWGKKKEPVAKKDYLSLARNNHQGFSMHESGLLLNPDYPEFGASPDGLINCSCCGSGVLEIKCPYNMRDSGTIEMPYLVNGKLKRESAYYYQVQTQLFMADRQYCDFFVWSPFAHHLERIYQDKELWSIICHKGQEFHRNVIMPELVCGFFSRRISTKELPTYCVCGGVDDGRRMIACDDDSCDIVWYHMSCINMKRAPGKGKKWYCSKCT